LSGTLFKYALDALGISRGGGNMSTALSLLEYTEFLGRVFSQHPQSPYSEHDFFELGFNLLPSDYKKLPGTPQEIRNVIKNSITNPSSKDTVKIGMLENNFCTKFNTNAGIVFKDKVWYFCVEKYYTDLITELDKLIA